MNEKYKKLMEEGLDTLRVDDSTYGYYVDGFTDCHDEMVKDYQALERKLEVAKRALEFYREEVNISIQIKDNGQFYMEECNDISSDCSFGATARQALAEIKG